MFGYDLEMLQLRIFVGKLKAVDTDTVFEQNSIHGAANARFPDLTRRR